MKSLPVKLAVLPFLLLAPATAGDWPRFLGPNHDAHSPETGLLREFPEAGPPVLWEIEHGESHTGPVIADGRLVFVHLVDGEEIIQCHDAAGGRLLWKRARPVEVGSSYGISDAPRAGPVIDPERGLVFTMGLAGDLLACRLQSGEVVWKRNLDDDFGTAPFFFGRGSCPLVWNDQLIVNTGGHSCVVSLDPVSGDLLWETAHEWHASYASPVPGTMHGRDLVFVFAGGRTDPPAGGLLGIDPSDGSVLDAFPWRARGYASVNAASPVVTDDAVFITEGYDQGGVLLDVTPEFELAPRWESPRFACQFSTPVAHDGHLYGFSGTSPAGAELVCFEIESGTEKWRFGKPLEVRFDGRARRVFLGRGSLLRVDEAFLALGAQGTLAWLDRSTDGVTVQSAAQLFLADETWGIPALSEGRLYVLQHTGRKRLICYDLRDG